MIVPLRQSAVIVSEIDAETVYDKYLFIVNPAGTPDDFYIFITTPSHERNRFLLSLNKNLLKTDENSIIEILQ